MNLIYFLLVIALLIAFSYAGAVLWALYCHGNSIIAWIAWLAFFLLISTRQDGTLWFRLMMSTGSASAVYQLTTSPPFQKKKDEAKDCAKE